jgi:hypothetical protein
MTWPGCQEGGDTDVFSPAESNVLVSQASEREVLKGISFILSLVYFNHLA